MDSPAMPTPMPMPAFAPVLSEPLLETGGAAAVWEADGMLEVEVVEDVVWAEVEVEEEVLDGELEVLVAAKAAIEKVLLRSLGAGASKASAMGLLQSTTLLVVLQQFHCWVVVL